jgi:DNA-binding beta-propeller fold protein YncE
MRLSITLVLLLLAMATMAVAAEVRTLAGNGSKTVSGDGGLALEAGVSEPFGLDIGPDGALYWAEFGGHVIRRMDPQTQRVSLYAGTPNTAGYADGPATAAKFDQPHELRFHPSGDLYISDMRTQTIRKIAWESKLVSTVAGVGLKAGFSGDGGPATAALMNFPIAVTLDGADRFLICDINNHRIRSVDLATGVIQTVAGTGAKAKTPDGAAVVGTPLHGPRTVAIDAAGDVIIVLREGSAVYRWNRKTGTLHHLAGTGKGGYSGDGGPAVMGQINGPKGVAMGPDGDIYLADTENHVIRVIRLKSGRLETLVGDGQKGDGPDGEPGRCRLNRPHGVFFDPQGRLYIGDSSNNKVRVVTLH